MNRVTLIGRLTRDIELRYTQNGDAVGSFNLAVQRKYQNSNGEYDADFIQCVIWKKPAETLSQYAHKGSRIGVGGQLQTRTYEDKDGKTVYVTEVNVKEFDFLDSKSKGDGQQEMSSNTAQQPQQQYQQQYQQQQYQQPQQQEMDMQFNIPNNPQMPTDDELPF